MFNNFYIEGVMNKHYELGGGAGVGQQKTLHTYCMWGRGQPKTVDVCTKRDEHPKAIVELCKYFIEDYGNINPFCFNVFFQHFYKS